MSITNAELTQMKERAGKATAGESIWLGETSEGHVLHSVIDLYGPDAEVYIKEGFVEFIAHAREDVPRLVAEVERLREHIQSALFYVENDGSFRDIYDELKGALGE